MLKLKENQSFKRKLKLLYHPTYLIICEHRPVLTHIDLANVAPPAFADAALHPVLQGRIDLVT